MVFVRRGSARKLAAAFRTDCFNELPTLADKLAGGWIDASTVRLATDVPVLYKLNDEQLAAAKKKIEKQAAKEAKAAAKAVAKAAKAAKKAAKQGR